MVVQILSNPARDGESTPRGVRADYFCSTVTLMILPVNALANCL